MNRFVLWVFFSVLFVSLTACGSSYQAREMDLQTTLVNPSLLEKGTGDQALYRYINKNADIKKYNRILLDRVMISKDGELDAKNWENYQRLANNAYTYLYQALRKDYVMVSAPGPNAMRLQMVILEADPSKTVRSVLSSVTPIGIGVDIFKYAATGKQSGVGEISMELQATDSETGKLLGAVVDRRVGGKNLKGVEDPWSEANAGLQWWAARTRYFLCVARGGYGCKKP